MDKIDIKTVIHIAIESLVVAAITYWLSRKINSLQAKVLEMEKALSDQGTAIMNIARVIQTGGPPRKPRRKKQPEPEEEEEEEDEDEVLGRELEQIKTQRQKGKGKQRIYAPECEGDSCAI